jgi:signal transduction histidine kinase
MQEKILIVEDEIDMANLLAYKLSEKGYETWLASNGKDALDRIKEEIPDVVLLDIMMEPLDGWGVCSIIRNSKNEAIKRLPIIILTALSESEDKIIGLRLGADDYMTKPFSMDELILRVQTVLRKKRTEDKLMDRLKRGNDIPALFYHEVRNQLYIIGAFSDLITRKGEEWETRAEFLGRLKNAAVALSEYLEGMSLFSKIENGEREIRLERLSLKETINKVIMSYKKDAAARGVHIEIGCSGEIDTVELNSIAMKMILSNLIGNAIKYNRKDGSILVTTLGNGNRLVITIEDTGLGIDPADIPHIFDNFYRSRRVEKHISGTGIGLYIVKTLVNAMGGEIKVESALGKGSKFTITFNAQGL